MTLLELLRAYADIFADCCYWLGFQVLAASEERLDENALSIINSRLNKLRDECERMNLQMSRELLEDAISETELAKGDDTYPLLHETIHHVCDILQRELSHQLFIKVNADRRLYYDSPFRNWQTVLNRFSGIVRDVEEMNKCFALSRYSAAMFHAMQIAEIGAIELGDYIGASDPKKGWDSTKRKLDELVRQGHLQLPLPLAGKFAFLEQMNREIETMVLAWRNKIDHAANRLAIIPNTDFTPDIAEHIMSAVRVFMLRLSEGLPASSNK